MRAIIPVAGVGSRLRPHTYTVPKVLLNVAGKPIIGHILDKITDAGIDEATIIIGYLGEKIREYVLANYRIKVDFIEQEERLGLGHAIYISKNAFTDQPILIILGDTIFDVDLKSMVSSKETLIGVKQVDDPRRFGVAETAGDYIERLIEKPEVPKSKLALVGLYFISRPRMLAEKLSIMIEKDVRTKGEYQLTDALQIMIDSGEKMKVFPIDGWFDCGKPETLLSTNRYLLRKCPASKAMKDVVIQPPVFISPSAKIKNAVIGPDATIAENAIVENALIRNSIVSEGATVMNSLIEDSIIGNNAVVRGNYKRINIGDSSELEFS
jgi:glucose-1-phosphate thymidylyltransferase